MSSTSSLNPPDGATDGRGKRMSYRVPPPPAPLNIPEPVDRRNARPPSPLRNSYTAEPSIGDFSEDGSITQDDEASVDRPWSQRSHSPSPSLTKLASNFAQRVGALVGSQSSRSTSGLPTEAELEAESERERERSRREAELIMKREEEERKMVEDGVFAMLEGSSQARSLPPPPPRSQTMSSNPPSPSSSQKEKESWFSAVKNKLTPTKEPLTPAQQIIQETKAKEKEKKKGKEKDWPATPNSKLTDPAFLALASTSSPNGPVTPPRPIGQNDQIMTPSPKRSIDSRDAPPLYAQFNNQGTLDVPGTLLTIARRFEKLERWTVSHVRALEERMGDVERWLVDKEKERESTIAPSNSSEKSSFHSDEHDPDSKENELGEIRDELVELQGRVGELGREMAKLMTAPLNLTSGPARNTVVSNPSPTVPPTPSSMGPRSLPTVPVPTSRTVSTPRASPPVTTPARPREVSPPPSISSSTSAITTASRTRLPYPTGDYASPPGSIPTKQDILSPTNSPPSSLTEATRRRPVSIAGLPSSNASFFQNPQLPSSTTSGLPRRHESPPVRALSPNSTSPLTAPNASALRTTPNISPTPRKRYTVALGAPITGAGAVDPDEYDGRSRNIFSSSPVSTPDVTGDEADGSDFYGGGAGEDDGDEEARAIGHSRDDTIGKSEGRMSEGSGGRPAGLLQRPNDTVKLLGSTSSPRNSPGTPRMRAQSSYGPPTGNMLSPSPSTSPTPITPLRLRLRSKSSDRIGLGISLPGGSGAAGSGPGRFVDPLVIRKQEKDALAPRTPKTPTFSRGQKVPVGQLVAFFDGDKR